MTLDEFLKHVYYTERSIIIPDLGRRRIEKSLFMKKGRLDMEAVKAHLTELYYSKYG